jgi:hypothetical protein
LGPSLRRPFLRLAAQAGVPKIRLHDACNTCASYPHAQGLPIAAVNAWLGHVNPRFTLAVYAHASADGLPTARDLLAPGFPVLVIHQMPFDWQPVVGADPPLTWPYLLPRLDLNQKPFD